MFDITFLNKKYEYDYSVKASLVKFLYSPNYLNRKDPFQMVSFINNFVNAHKWPWDEITLYNCKKVEFIIQEKLPSHIHHKNEIYRCIVKLWREVRFSSEKVS
jgi:hypothetical protein